MGGDKNLFETMNKRDDITRQEVGIVTYCSKCGNMAKEGAQFCDRCGAPLGGGYQQPYGQPAYPGYAPYRPQKEPLIAVILSILLPGIGQVYAGRVGRGILIFLLVPLLSVMPALSLFAIVSVSNFGAIWTLAIIVSIIAFIVYVWQIVDAYRCVEEYNRQGGPRY